MILRFNSDDLREGFERLSRRLVAISTIADHAGDLMEHWERVIEADNREGVLAGTDKDGGPAPPLTYRPLKQTLRAIASGKPPKLSKAQRLGQRGNVRRGKYAGSGPMASGLHNNLTSGEYRRLDGPRLAPRRQFSRAITNLVTGHGRDPANPRVWFAEGAWLDVVSRKGVRFLRFHFDGEGQRKYDLRGVRPAGRVKLRDALREWAKLEIRERYKAG